MKKIGKFISTAVCCLAVAIIILVFLMFYLGRDGDISKLVWTQDVLDSYNSSPEHFEVEYIKSLDDHYFTEDGYISISSTRRITSTGQWQMTIRYNESTLESMVQDRKLSSVPSGDVFTFRLVDDGGVTYDDFSYIKTVKGRYTYYRLVFDNVNIRKVDEIDIYIYLLKDVVNGVYPEHPYERLPLYYAEMPRDSYDYKSELPDDRKPTQELLPSTELKIEE